MNSDIITTRIQQLSEKHILKRSSPQYVEGFVNALLSVHSAKKVLKKLQTDFYVPNEANYSDLAFCRAACELTVANHLKLNNPTTFQAEKNLNPPPINTDVDAYCEINGYKVAVDVKCPELIFKKYDSKSPIMEVAFAGRYDDHAEQFEELRSTVNPTSAMQVERAQRRDGKLQGYLDGVESKFHHPSEADEINILFVALDDYHSMTEWNGYLFSNKGFFTERSYHPNSLFQSVDVVMLSSLQLWHLYARDFHDWTLNNVYMIPRINPRPRQMLTDLAVAAGLSAFPHQLKGFNQFLPYEPEDDETARPIRDFLKISKYACDGLSLADYKRYFPVNTSRMVPRTN